VTSFNQPKERVAQWFFDPLLTIRDQLRAAHLQESEEHYLEKLVLIAGNEERINAWDNGAVEPDDGMRKGELQALARRLQGITASIARLPTHRRRFEALIKSLLPYAQERSNKIQANDTGHVIQTGLDKPGSIKKDSFRSSFQEPSPHVTGDDAV
jgi:hypothetical protein